MLNKYLILLVCLYAFLSSGENAGHYSFEYMRDFFSGSPLKTGEKDLSYEATSNGFYNGRARWLAWAEEEISTRLADGAVFEKRYRWQAPSDLGYGEIASSVRSAWGKAYAQGGMYGLEVEKAIKSLGLLEEFQKRLSDPGDSLHDVVRYRDLLSIASIPWKLYWLAEKLYWNGNYEKAVTVMSLRGIPGSAGTFYKGAEISHLSYLYFLRLYRWRERSVRFGRPQGGFGPNLR